MAVYQAELLEIGRRYLKNDAKDGVLKVNSDIIINCMQNCKILFAPENRFFCTVDCDGLVRDLHFIRTQQYNDELERLGLQDGQEALAHTGGPDIGHTCAHWESIIPLGIFGLRERIAQYRDLYGKTEKKKAFYDELLRVYDAALQFMLRAADAADANGNHEMAQSLRDLTQRSPSTLFEAMQTSLLYYVLQQMFDGTVLRTMGRIDQLFYPFYRNEDADTAKTLVEAYLQEINALAPTANIPFALGGTDPDGNSLVNELSYLFLSCYGKAHLPDTKLHLYCSKNTPNEFIEQGLDCVRNGNNSIVFLSNEAVIASLKKLGAQHNDAVNYHVVGCYECGAEQELTCSCNARVNLPKALELALNNGRDMLTGKKIGLENDGSFPSFEAVFTEFLRQTEYLCKCAMKITDLHEMHYAQTHAAPIMTATYPHALEQGGDLYGDNAAKYNNSSLNAIGLATVTDSLAAIRKLVFEEKQMTIDQLIQLLKSDWAEHEPLRLMIRNKYPKYGNADPAIDTIAQKTVDFLSRTVSGHPNKKGGVYRLGLFSIDWRWQMGEKTAASADGRLAGQPLSQNSGATFGADRSGATAHLISVASLDSSGVPNGLIVDLDLHSSCVKGANGLQAFTGLLRSYFALGGFAVHCNVLDTETLKKAKDDPAAYPNLQVRLCGWNVLFSSLSDKEKDEFIARSIQQGSL